MPKMTKAQHRQMDAARARLDAAAQEAYAAVLPRQDVRLWECLKLASEDVRARFHDAQSALVALECDMVSAGRGYRSSNGSFVANS